ncbi:sigma-54 interaction domain-containing protein [Rhodopila sp.]|uniref:sigma-54 interaction domain-containing protein n=1 Tax=Rhodopila sp. TaxID=2480087 RepID=UPI002D807A00|nr:sigma-54 dependent transcriptional regulator [Rhodopila sp.]
MDELSRLSPRHLARLLLERAAEDPTLLGRLYDTVDVKPTSIPRTPAIIGRSVRMRHAMELVHRFEKTDEPVLITGESGTGKELLARAIHDGSRRAAGPFVAVNCAALPPGLVASELFGYEKGAFTGAAARTLGQIEHAQGGTLFLDEIGDMPVDLQGHLLRFLQEGQIRRVGGREMLRLDVRIVSATNVRLRQAIAEGRFREDLFYRLNVLTLAVPPLRERRDDIALLANHFLRLAARDFEREVTGFSPEAMAALLHHRWPGNVRELMSVVRRAVVISDGGIIEADALDGLEERLVAPSAPRPGSPEERAALLATLERTKENVTSTAEALCVSRVTLYRMLRRHGIELKRGLADSPVTRRVPHAHS